MTRSQILETAATLTENKGSNLNPDRLYIYGLQKFCGEKRFWWRKKTLYFTTVAATATYDLSSVTTVPADGGDEVEELIQVVYVRNSTSFVELTPLFDDLVQQEIIESALAGEPGGYFIDPNSYQTIRFNVIPNGAYKIRANYWAMPNPALDSVAETVPIVPAYLHYVLVDRLKMDIWEAVYGSQDPKYLTAAAEYERGVAKAMIKQGFDVNYAPSFKSNQPAVRSTR